MAVIRSLLNGGIAEVDDAQVKSFVDSGHWVVDGDAPVRKPRVSRVKKAPVEEPKTGE